LRLGFLKPALHGSGVVAGFMNMKAKKEDQPLREKKAKECQDGRGVLRFAGMEGKRKKTAKAREGGGGARNKRMPGTEKKKNGER